MSEWLNDWELEQLLEAQDRVNRARMVRLLNELRTLRDQASERERMANDEVAW